MAANAMARIVFSFVHLVIAPLPIIREIRNDLNIPRNALPLPSTCRLFLQFRYYIAVKPSDSVIALLLSMLHRWLDRITPPGRIATLQEFSLREVDDTLQADFALLETGLFGKESAGTKQVKRLSGCESLARARKRMLRRRGHSTSSGAVNLPDLNP
jgi:hypothetical protein